MVGVSRAPFVLGVHININININIDIDYYKSSNEELTTSLTSKRTRAHLRKKAVVSKRRVYEAQCMCF